MNKVNDNVVRRGKNKRNENPRKWNLKEIDWKTLKISDEIENVLLEFRPLKL